MNQIVKQVASTIDEKSGEVGELNLLYWSILSGYLESVQCCLSFLRKRNLLSAEINKFYPNATIIHVLYAVRIRNKDFLELTPTFDQLEKSTLLHTFEAKNVFEDMFGERNARFFGKNFVELFSSTARSDVFFMESRVEVLTKNNVRLAVNSGEKKLFSPQSARIF